jgi:hypothetical protein
MIGAGGSYNADRLRDQAPELKGLDAHPDVISVPFINRKVQGEFPSAGDEGLVTGSRSDFASSRWTEPA